jgi:ACS family hexuronate transporter-like MFS transporter
VLGFGEAFNWVCATGIVQRIIPRASRGIANAIFHGGASVGAALTPFLALALVGSDGTGWRHLFMAVGAAGLIWIVIWLWLLRGDRAQEVSHPAASNKEAAKNELPFFRIFTMRIFWIALGVGLAVNIVWHMYRVWLPRLLDVEFKFTHVQIQYALATFFVIADLGGMFTGWITRKIIHNGMETERARRMVLLVTGLVCLSSGFFAYTKDPYVAMAGFCAIGACAMGMFSIFYSMSQDISGPQTSRVLGVIGAMIWLVISVIHPQVGKWVDQTKDFKPVFVLFGIVPIMGFIAALFWHAKHTQDASTEQEKA